MSQERAAEVVGLDRRDFIRALARENMDVFIVDDESLARELGLAMERFRPRRCKLRLRSRAGVGLG